MSGLLRCVDGLRNDSCCWPQGCGTPSISCTCHAVTVLQWHIVDYLQSACTHHHMQRSVRWFGGGWGAISAPKTAVQYFTPLPSSRQRHEDTMCWLSRQLLGQACTCHLGQSHTAAGHLHCCRTGPQLRFTGSLMHATLHPPSSGTGLMLLLDRTHS